MPRLAAIATADAPCELDQGTAKKYASALLGPDHPALVPLLRVFDTSGVRTRRLARPPEWYFVDRGWAERTRAFVECGLDLLEAATNQALDRAQLSREQVDGIVLVTSTGLSTPSLDARLANRMKLRTDLLRVPVWGLGCAGGVAGLARTADLATARPRGRFLLLSLELCSLAFLRSKLNKKILVASTLFGDGCAAAVVEGDAIADPSHPAWVAGASHRWPDTEYVMGWDVLDEGLDVILDPSIPAFVEEHAGAPLRAFAGTPDSYAFHPGGPKVLDAFERALGVAPAAFQASRDVLADHGNMSSPTVFYVLERVLAAPKPGRVLLSALGPGFAAESALLAGPGAA